MLKGDDIAALVEKTVNRFGRLDVLVNNAGTHLPRTTEDITEEEWDFLFKLNVKALWLSTKFALPHLKATRGNIVHMASATGLVGQERSIAYAATKGAVISLTKNMALDFAEYGIRCNCICPCAADTPLLGKWILGQPDPEAARAEVAKYHLFPRLITIEEIGYAAAFLASSEAAMINGIPLLIDCGACLGYRRAG